MIYTDDIPIEKAQGWVEIPLLTNGTYVDLVQTTNVIRTKLDVNSTSKGVFRRGNDELKAGQSIFVKNEYAKGVTVTVFRDGD